MSPADRSIRDHGHRASTRNPTGAPTWREYAIGQAAWDEGHIQPAIEIAREEPSWSSDRILQEIEEDLRDRRSKDQFRAQHEDELGAHVDEAFEVYVQAYLDHSKRRLEHKNPSGHSDDVEVQRFAALLRHAYAWMNGPFRPNTDLMPYMTRVPKEATGQPIDRMFWGGEVIDEINADAQRTLSPAQLAIYRSIASGLRSMDDHPRLLRRNPEGDARELAVAKYEEFHRYKPTKIGEFHRDFEIPSHVFCGGKAKWTTYRSAKVDPSTLKKPRHPVNYIHEHDAGVMLYLPEDSELVADLDLEEVVVPRVIQDAEALVMLGQSLGFCFELEGAPVEAEGAAPLPELYCTPDGKCLLVIQDKRQVLAMLWGGGLGVFPRGIDG